MKPPITRFRLEGYRAIPPGQPVELRLARLTLLIGPNGSGKTSILEALARLPGDEMGTVEDTYKLLGFTVEAGVELATVLLLYPKAKSTLSARVASKIVSVYTRALEEVVKPDYCEGLPAESRATLAVDMLLEKRRVVEELAKTAIDRLADQTKAVDVEVAYHLADGRLRPAARRSKAAAKLFLDLIHEEAGELLQAINDAAKVLRAVCGGRPASSIEALPRVLAATFASVVADGLLGALRSRVTLLGSERSMGTLVSIRDPLGGLLYTMYPDPDVYQRLLRWLGLAGRYTRLRVIPRPDGGSLRIEVYDGFAGEWIPLGRAAGGLRYSLPVLFTLAASTPGSVVLIDDPELGLHPQAQIRIAEALLEAAKRGVQVVAATHSPALLLRVLFAVASGEAGEEDVAILLVYRDEEQVYVEELQPRLPLRPSERAEKALREMGVEGLFGEEPRLAMDLLKTAAAKG